MAIATAVAIVSLDTIGLAFVAGALYLVCTTIEGQFVTPYFVGRALRLNVVVVFISVTLWAWLWSVVGMLVATPMLVAIRTFCEHIPALEPFGDFLSGRGEEVEASPAAAAPVADAEQAAEELAEVKQSTAVASRS